MYIDNEQIQIDILSFNKDLLSVIVSLNIRFVRISKLYYKSTNSEYKEQE